MNVFIGSTYQDLADYRRAALEVCISLGLLPVAMEFFEAMGYGATEGSKRKVAECDVYVGIVAFRYGYIEPGFDRSVTEIEFEHAGELGLERLCFLADIEFPFWKEQSQKVDRPTELERFKEKVNQHIRATFTGVDNFQSKLMHALVKWKERRSVSTPTVEVRKDTLAGSIAASLIDDVRNLRYRAEKFVQRDTLMDQALEALMEGKSVLLHGLGGSGKTALAEEIAAHIIENKGPILRVRAGENDFEAMYTALLLAFGGGVVMPERAGARQDQLAQLFDQYEVQVLVIDDVWNGKALHDLLRYLPKNFPVLVTSRMRLPLKEIIPVGILSEARALELLSFHAQRDYGQDEVAAKLCEHLEYLAFAVEVAGRTLYVTGESPRELLERIEDAPTEFAVPNDFAEEGRTKVADLLEASLRRLDERANSIFVALGAFFAKNLTPELLAIYTGLDLPTVRTALNQLYTNGLAERRDFGADWATDYRVHSLVWSYAHAQTTHEDRLKAVEVCLEYLERYNAPPTFFRLKAELDNFIGAAEWALQSDDPQVLQTVRRFADGLYRGPEPDAPGGFLDLQGYPNVALQLTDFALNAARRQGDRLAEAGYLGNLGSAYRDIGQLDHAGRCFRQSRELFHEMNNPHGYGLNIARLGVVLRSQGKLIEALETSEQALKIMREMGDRYWEAIILNNLGNVYGELHDDLREDEAMILHQQALEIARSVEVADRRVEGSSLQGLGVLHRKLKRTDEAIEYLTEALRIAENIGDRRMESAVLGNLGLAYRDDDELAEAFAYLERSLKIAREIVDKRAEAITLGSIGTVHQKQGDWNRALDYYRLAINADNRHPEGKAINLGRIGEVYESMSKLEDALACYTEAAELYRKAKHAESERYILIRIGNLNRRLHRPHEAVKVLEQALALARTGENWQGETIALGLLGMAHKEAGAFDMALTMLHEAYSITHEQGDVRGESIVLGNLGSVYYEVGEFKEAGGYFEQALAIDRQIGNRRGEIINLQRLADVYRGSGMLDDAILTRQLALELAESMQDERGIAMNLSGLGQLYFLKNDLEQAQHFLTEAVTRRRNSGVDKGMDLELLAQITRDRANARDYLMQARAIFVKHALQERIVDVDRKLSLLN